MRWTRLAAALALALILKGAYAEAGGPAEQKQIAIEVRQDPGFPWAAVVTGVLGIAGLVVGERATRKR